MHSSSDQSLRLHDNDSTYFCNAYLSRLNALIIIQCHSLAKRRDRRALAVELECRYIVDARKWPAAYIIYIDILDQIRIFQVLTDLIGVQLRLQADLNVL